ncbi:MAG: hypothetical protein LBS19_08960 [Clostridiales bacterium]|jgi:Kef-type K+ transport system membrane component KefB|nr:hypothetical protein [Clostridiales bacterium]
MKPKPRLLPFIITVITFIITAFIMHTLGTFAAGTAFNAGLLAALVVRSRSREGRGMKTYTASRLIKPARVVR